MWSQRCAENRALVLPRTREPRCLIRSAHLTLQLNEENSTADIFIVCNCSTSELPTVEKYADRIAKDKTMVLWNLELDTLRADLGLFGFPPKDLQYRFLSQFRPVVSASAARQRSSADLTYPTSSVCKLAACCASGKHVMSLG